MLEHKFLGRRGEGRRARSRLHGSDRQGARRSSRHRCDSLRHRPHDPRLPRSRQTLQNEFGIDAEVVDVLTLAPLDEETILESVKRTHRLVVVDEDNPVCSMARDIAARAADKAFDYLDAPVKTVTAPDTPVPFSAVLEWLYTPQAAQVVAAVREQLDR